MANPPARSSQESQRQSGLGTVPSAGRRAGEISQKAKMALRYRSATQTVADQPMALVFGDSLTMRMPISSSDNVRMRI